MEHVDLNAIGLILFRIIALLVGAMFAVLGYKLFKLGYFEKAGELKATWGTNKLLLKQTAPGVFFALFGTIVVGIGTWKPLNVRAEPQPLPYEVNLVLQKIVQNEQISENDKKLVARWLTDASDGRRRSSLEAAVPRPDGRI